MTIKLSSWNKTCDTEWIPSCQAHDIYNVIPKNKSTENWYMMTR